MGRIVVGVDGSDASKVALDWAIGEARLRGAGLEVLCSYTVPTAWLGAGDTMGAGVITAVTETDIAGYAAETLTSCLATTDHAGVEVSTHTVSGHPAACLVEASKDADLLVVGSRGHGDIGSVLLGSVGLHCVHHAVCPVVVVHPPASPEEETRRGRHGHRRR
ncbi:MAG TPA: universal stress protein [Acidimicrobiales bacterium]|nr:universal stress protein [Acidimicrobiales bacterium]